MFQVKGWLEIYISLLIFSGPDPDNFFLFAFRHVRTSSIYTYGTNAKIFFNFAKFDLLQDPPQIKFYNHFEEILAHGFNIRGIQKLCRQEGVGRWTLSARDGWVRVLTVVKVHCLADEIQ